MSAAHANKYPVNKSGEYSVPTVIIIVANAHEIADNAISCEEILFISHLYGTFAD